MRDGVGVEEVDDGGGGVTVRTAAGPVAARVVVGCDGVGSVVRQSMGLGPGELRAQVIEVDTEPIAGDRDRALLHFDSTDGRARGYAWDFPTVVDGRPLVCRGVYHLKSSRRGGQEGPDLGALLAERLRAQGIDPSLCQEQALRGARIRARVAPRARVPDAGRRGGRD